MPTDYLPIKPTQAVEAPPPLFDRARSDIKNLLTLYTLIFVITLICESAYVVQDSARQGYWYWSNGWIAAFLGGGILSAIWLIADGVTQRRRGVHRPIPPGAHVAAHLFLWMTFTGLAGYFTSIYVNWHQGDLARALGFTDNTFVKRTYRLALPILINAYIIVIGHFTLFVYACVDTNQLRHHNREVLFANMANASQLLPTSQPGYAPISLNVGGIDTGYNGASWNTGAAEWHK